MKHRVLLVSERSAGHVYPALAIGEKFKEKNYDIFFFTSSNFFKTRLKDKGYTVLGLAFNFRNILLEFFWRFSEAIYILLKICPHWVIGFGGRDSFFLVFFSFILGSRVSIYEPNRKMGRANRVLSLFIKNTLRGIPPLDKKKGHKIIGIPLGKNAFKMEKEKILRQLNFNRKPVVLCFGGSQGSHFINNKFIEFVDGYKKDSYQIIHITGKTDYQEMINFYKKAQPNKIVKDFCQNMPLFYNIADLVISRAGALTLAEISFYRIPAILIPHPKGGGHQKINANYLAEKKSAVLFDQDNFNFKKFKTYLIRMIEDGSFRKEIKDNLKEVRIGLNYENFSFNSID